MKKGKNIFPKSRNDQEIASVDNQGGLEVKTQGGLKVKTGIRAGDEGEFHAQAGGGA